MCILLLFSHVNSVSKDSGQVCSANLLLREHSNLPVCMFVCVYVYICVCVFVYTCGSQYNLNELVFFYHVGSEN